MTKTSKTAAPANCAVSLALPTEAGVQAVASQGEPTAIELVGPIANVLAQVTALSRLGFTVNTNAMPSMFPTTGTAIIVMIKGDPDPMMAEEADRAMQDAAAREQFAMLDAAKRAEAAAKEQEEQAAKEATKAAISVEIAAQQESLRKLQATLAAA